MYLSADLKTGQKKRRLTAIFAPSLVRHPQSGDSSGLKLFTTRSQLHSDLRLPPVFADGSDFASDGSRSGLSIHTRRSHLHGAALLETFDLLIPLIEKSQRELIAT